MQLGIVSTKRSSLKVYSTTNSSATNHVGNVDIGTVVEITDTRTVNNVIWAKIKGEGISGWVIQKHPSVNYNYLSEVSKARALGSNTGTTALDTGLTTVSLATMFNSSPKIDTSDYVTNETIGIVKIPTEGNKNTTFCTGETSPIEYVMKSNLLSGEDKRSTDGDNDSDSTTPPRIVQNVKGFPKLIGKNNGRWEYDYTIDYDVNGLDEDMAAVRKSLNLDIEDSDLLFETYARYFNRFRVENPNDMLIKAFPYVFITRPDCNIVNYTGSNTLELASTIGSDTNFKEAFRNNRSLLMQLSSQVGLNNQFMMFASNKVTSFDCKDRNLETDDYGKNKRGFSVSYGKTLDDSLKGGEVSISFSEDRNLHILKLHQYWQEYISGVTRGRFMPRREHKINRVLDYAASIYYIVVAENGEDIIYWSKLYGAFPTSIPDSTMSWSEGQIISAPKPSITYKYSWKEDCKMSTIIEFNMLSDTDDFRFMKSYDPNILSTGTTWVGAPFIETTVERGRSILKLRFRPT